jgi:hypothetical protein
MDSTTKGGSRQETPQITTTKGSSDDHEYKVQLILLPPCIDSVDDMNEKAVLLALLVSPNPPGSTCLSIRQGPPKGPVEMGTLPSLPYPVIP